MVKIVGIVLLALLLAGLLPGRAYAQCSAQYYQGSTALPLTLTGNRAGDEYTLVSIDIPDSQMVIDVQRSGGDWVRNYVSVGQSYIVPDATLQVILSLESRTLNGGEIEICTPTPTSTPTLTATATLTPTATATATSTAIAAVVFDLSDLVTVAGEFGAQEVAAWEPGQPYASLFLALAGLMLTVFLVVFLRSLVPTWRDD